MLDPSSNVHCTVIGGYDQVTLTELIGTFGRMDIDADGSGALMYPQSVKLR
jgi:hypothetical protein